MRRLATLVLALATLTACGPDLVPTPDDGAGDGDGDGEGDGDGDAGDGDGDGDDLPMDLPEIADMPVDETETGDGNGDGDGWCCDCNAPKDSYPYFECWPSDAGECGSAWCMQNPLDGNLAECISQCEGG